MVVVTCRLAVLMGMLDTRLKPQSASPVRREGGGGGGGGGMGGGAPNTGVRGDLAKDELRLVPPTGVLTVSLLRLEYKYHN